MRFISFGILVSGILLIRKVMWKYISRKTQYALWIFPALFLLLNPFWNISSKWSIENILFIYESKTLQEAEGYFPDMWNQSDNFVENSDNYVYGKQSNNDTGMVDEIEREDKQEEDWNPGIYNNKEKGDTSAFPLLMVSITDFWQRNWENFRQIISLILICVIGVSNIKFYRFCLKNRSFFRNEKEVKVYFLEGIGSPFLLGKDIYIDKNIIENKTILKHIIMHEYCHYKHRDYFWVILRNLCLIIYWYHPFVWLANEFAKRDCELACDEAVMLGLKSKEYEEYGYTLISVLKHSRPGQRHTAISSVTNHNMKNIKERLIMIKMKNKCSRGIAVMCIICIAILTGCTFTQKTVSKEEKVEKEEVVNHEISDLEPQEDISEKYYNGYYNVSAKAYGESTYVVTEEGIYCILEGSSTFQLLYEGSVTMGTLEEDRLFFYSYSKDEDKAAIMSLNLSTGDVMVSYILEEDFYSYMEMTSQNGKLYINKQGEIAVFEVQKDGTLQRKEPLQITVPKELQSAGENSKPVSPVIAMGEGYSENFYYERKEDSSCVRVYDGDTLVNEIDNITDIMITEKGVIGRDINNHKDVFLWNIYTGEKKSLYQSLDNENKLWIYTTYDENGVYGLLQETDNSYIVSRISWGGVIEKLFEIEEVEIFSDVKMSVIGDWIYYCNQVTGKMERRNLMNLMEIEIIQ